MTLVVAHRGASLAAPENTMAAYRLAVEMGADAIELDVHLTRDGELALIHDDSLDRTTNLTGPVADRTMDQLRAADAGFQFTGRDGSFPYRGRGLQIPTLDEVLAWLPAGVGLVVEIKSRSAVETTVAHLRGSAVRAAEAVSVVSFDERAIDEVHRLDPELPTGYLLVPSESFEEALTYAVEHGHVAVHAYDGDLGLDPSPKLTEARAYGRQVGCYVVNDPDRMRILAAYRLWGFVTDDPALARATLGPTAP